ncbi:MAG: ComF family protein [Solobacterium sp.]|nr:ComF family protein [Solobacterium sp.]
MYCLMCGKYLSEDSFSDFFRKKDLLCRQCHGEWKFIRKKGVFESCPAYYLYEYNDAFSKCLIQFKECGDEALKSVFLYPEKEQLRRRFAGRTLLLLPSSEENLQKRGFSHLREMFEILKLPMMEPFEKTVHLDQKTLGRRGRARMEEAIRLRPGIRLPKKVVLADDVITTGATMRGALSCLGPGADIRIFACAKVPERTRSSNP